MLKQVGFEHIYAKVIKNTIISYACDYIIFTFTDDTFICLTVAGDYNIRPYIDDGAFESNIANFRISDLIEAGIISADEYENYLKEKAAETEQNERRLYETLRDKYEGK